MQKDMRLASEAARTLSVRLPPSAAADKLLTARELDNEHREAAMLEVLAQVAGSNPAGEVGNGGLHGS
jgi:3-hydroxyisobutyrate dehydrogenase-like beta-hydroxyacid dehydrogenase